jgi:hypothetical protein
VERNTTINSFYTDIQLGELRQTCPRLEMAYHLDSGMFEYVLSKSALRWSSTMVPVHGELGILLCLHEIKRKTCINAKRAWGESLSLRQLRAPLSLSTNNACKLPQGAPRDLAAMASQFE